MLMLRLDSRKHTQTGRVNATTSGVGAANPLPALPVQAGMIQAARNGDAPWTNLEQLVVRDPAPAPAAHVVARALETLAQRHEGLRLIAAEGVDGTPVLIPRVRPVPAIATRDWSALPPADQDAALETWLQADREQGIDLVASPGWRVLLADLGEQGHACVLSIHHALADGPTLAVVMEELFDLVEGRALPAPRPDGLRAFARLVGTPPADAPSRAATLLNGFDRPTRLTQPQGSSETPPPGRTLVQTRRLDIDTSARLRARAQASGGSFALVQAAWALVLARWTGEDDVAFGLTLGGRNLAPGFDRTVGCLIATLPQRITLTDRPNLDTLGARLRAQTTTLRGLHGASGDDLRQWAGLAPGLTLYDSVLVFSRQTVASRLRSLGQGWQHREVRLIEAGDIPLTVAVYDEPELLIDVEHDPARLSIDRARRLTDHLARLLASMADASAGAALGELSMLSGPEGDRLNRLSRPDRPAPATAPCPALAVAALARAEPAAPALIAGDRKISRAALDVMVASLAGRIAATVPPGGRVALNLPRGVDHVVAVLACLRARRVFVPLDPAQPADLRADLALSAGVAAVIGMGADPDLPGLPLPWLPATHSASTAYQPARARKTDDTKRARVELRTPQPDPLETTGIDAPTAAAPPPDPDACAYVIHTSGSTGRPKGVMGRTGALANHAAAMIDTFGLTASDRVLALAAPAFDVALEEILPTLVAGAKLVIAPPEALTSVPTLLDLIARHRISVLNLPASLWHLLVDDMAQRHRVLPASVRLVVTGSERVAPGALARWQTLAPGARWMNAYGPTEATITAIAYGLEPGSPPVDPDRDVPIGRPLPHATARVLAFDGSPAPEGAPGQLWIGGAAVTLGYLDRPDETRAAFHPDPDRAAPDGARIYATGDRALWRADGQLAFLGRRDRQVKLRGHRIDLGGVERALGALEGVRGVHVDLDPQAGRLVAWITGPAAQGGPDGLARLRAAAARRLAGPSLPVLVPMEALPLRANGKIDPAALPPPPVAGPGPIPVPDTAPLPHRLAEVAAVMAEVLRLDTVDPDIDFRDLGGHSLAALRLAGAIEARFGRRTRTTDLYRHPTARLLAAHIEAPADGPRYVVPIQPDGSGIPFFAVHVLGEKETLFRPLAAALGPNHPVLGLTMGPPKDPGSVDVHSIAKAYFDDIQRHYPSGPIALGAVSMASYFAFDLAQQLRAAGRDVRLLAVFDAEGPDGRPSLRGREKLMAHIAQIRDRGPGHLLEVIRARLNHLRFARDVILSRTAEVNGATLVLANVRAVETYRPEPYLGRMAVFRAADSFWDSPQALASALGWASVARGGVDLFDIPGDHLSILQPGHVDRIAALLTRLLPTD
jgi:amino acid adenylation domain-containing protein